MAKKKIRVEQQGDVVMIPNQKSYAVDPKGAALKGKVIQEGEHTGHAHRISKGFGSLREAEGTRFLKVGDDGLTITHEEHLPCEIEKNDYEVRIVRQKDPFSKIIAKVVD